ncbi:MAG TPA: NUDIX domain-containing protein [Patescibacteria group bacterium]|jgi:NADH pyrophosphatase NudC (nudix superfamily)
MTDWKYCPQCRKPLEPKQGQTGETFPTCPEGHFTFYDSPDPSACAVVEQDGKYLVLRRNIEPNKGKWEIPGGFIDSGEGAEEALLREAREETGLEVKIVRYIGSFPCAYGDTDLMTVSVAYHAAVTGGTFKLSREAKESRWVDLNEFPEMAFASDQRIVDAFVRSRKKPSTSNGPAILCR